MSKVFTHPVIISGAGPAGLLLGHALKRTKIPFEIYERDASLLNRPQGYRFKIHDAGVTAVDETLSKEHFDLLRRSCGKQFEGYFAAALDAQKAEPTGMKPPMRGGPVPLNADRSTFRAVLSQGLEDKIHFGHVVSGYDLAADKQSVNVKFEDGSVRTASLLVAADGAWSKIRQQYLPQLNPLDTSGRAFYGKTLITSELLSALNSSIHQGMSLIRDTSRETPATLLLEPMYFDHTIPDDYPSLSMPHDYVYWVLGSRVERFEELGWQDSLHTPAPEDCVALLKKLTSDWHPSLQPLFDAQDHTQTSIVRIFSMPPDLVPWTSSRVTVIGDAAHVMSPTAGSGAAAGLRDAATLGRLLGEVKTQDDVVKAVEEYETKMRVYAKEFITFSEKAGMRMFGMKPIAEWKAT